MPTCVLLNSVRSHTPALLVSAFKCCLYPQCLHNGNSVVIFTLRMVFFRVGLGGISVGVRAISHGAELVHSSWAPPAPS